MDVSMDMTLPEQKYFSGSYALSSSAAKECSGGEREVGAPEMDSAARGNMYRILSTIYLCPPEPEFLRRFLDRDFLEELSLVSGGRAVEDLISCAATTDLDKDFASLKQEYMALFAVPTGRYVTPFEDCYWGMTVEGKRERRPLMGERAVDVRRMYRRAGAKMDQSCKELPTHIGVELSFMSYLCDEEAAVVCSEGGDVPEGQPDGRNVEVSIRYRELQIRFLREHLNEWFPQLSRVIQAKARSRFYRGLALFTEEFLARDMAALLAQRPNQEGMGERPEDP
jgi:TorA maturation chaperone TorD